MLMCCAICAKAQMSQTGYLMSDNPLSHYMNPAFQPDSAYMSLPLLGNSSLRWRSSMQLDDLLFDTKDGKVTTFMSSNTISKAKLMDKVGSGFTTSLDGRLTLLSMGRRVSDKRYQTLDVNLRSTADVRIAKGVFRALKDVENGVYDFSGTTLEENTTLDIAVSESRRINQKLTLGIKARMLVGLLHADLKTENLTVELADDKWTAKGNVEANLAGLKYNNKVKEYKDKPGTYTAVGGASLDGLMPKGLGLAIDAGAIYRHDEHWTVSASILDLGLMSWFGSNRARNGGQEVSFDGFHGVTVDKEDDNSAQKQLDRLSDDLMDMINLQDKGRHNKFSMLAFTVNAGASYKYRIYTFGALLTGRVHGHYSWMEGRLQAGINPWRWLNVSLSPSYNNRYGFAMGGMADFTTRKGMHIFLSSDRLALYRVNKQFIPRSLSADLQLGMTLPM